MWRLKKNKSTYDDDKHNEINSNQIHLREKSRKHPIYRKKIQNLVYSHQIRTPTIKTSTLFRHN